MFDGFFENNPPIKSEQADKERVDNIKAAVLKSIRENSAETDLNVCGESEVTPMKKRSIARSFIIAAAIASLGTMSLVSANAISDSALTSNISDTSSTFDETLTGGFSFASTDCISDEALTDGTKELYSIFVIDENGEEHFIARDYIEWTENEAGGFDIFYDAAPEALDAMRSYFDVETSPVLSIEEVLKGNGDCEFKLGDEDINLDAENIRLAHAYARKGDLI
ncbi:MAG: hypothetical protein HDT47_04325 [Ruminococcaceae bacterium]|nr:hypothetical protein [Oscillospiraceae bacterium]